MTTIDVDVTANADDGSAYQTGSAFSATETNEWFGFASGNVEAFFVYSGISGLSGSTIDVSYISIYTVNITSSGADMLVQAEDVETATAPTDLTEFNAKTLTSASVAWDDIPDADAFTDSPSINSVIQELANSYDPDVIGIYLKSSGAGDRTSMSFHDHPASRDPKLHIEYTAGGGGIVPQYIHHAKQLGFG